MKITKLPTENIIDKTELAIGWFKFAKVSRSCGGDREPLTRLASRVEAYKKFSIISHYI